MGTGYWGKRLMAREKEHDTYFQSRPNPAAFTLESKISKEMWSQSIQDYESNKKEYTG